MKAMVLAAGLGTRLRPLTDDRPKGLVEVGGRTLLEITLARLRRFGVREAVVNLHHFADKVAAYLAAHENFGMRIELSREPLLLDTGGGLKQAAPFLLDGRDEPFLLHNVDVISTIDLARMLAHHRESGALATLAVQRRVSSRQLLFDRDWRLVGRLPGRDLPPEMAVPADHPEPLAFCGIHVISPSLLQKLDGEGAFPIVPAYLKLAAAGERIVAFRADEFYWRDLGRPEHLAAAEEDLRTGRLTLD